MNKAATLKYGMITSLKNVFPFYGTLICLLILFYMINTGSHTSSMGSWDIMALFVAFGVGSAFKERFHFLLQNGYSRTTVFLNFLFCFFIMAIIMSLFEVVTYFTSEALHMNYNPAFNSLYELRYATSDSLLWLDSFLWHMFVNFCMMTIALFGNALFYRSSKIVRIIVFIILPVILFLGFPIINAALFDGILIGKIFTFIIEALGIMQGDPYLAMATFSVISLLMLIASYLVIKHTDLQR